MSELKHPAAKAASAIGITTGATVATPAHPAAMEAANHIATLPWDKMAQAAAFIYSVCLFIEWLWKRILKPYAQRKGWVGGRRRDFLDSTGETPLEK